MIRSHPSKNLLCIYLLGTYNIKLNGQSIHFPTKKYKALFAYLILHLDPISRETLSTLFWGDSSQFEARGSLRHALTIIRRYLSKNIILADRECVRINPSFPMWLDINEFQKQAQQFLVNPPILLKEINTILYMGDLLPDFYDDWVFPLREQNHALFIKVLFRSIELFRAQSDYALAIEYAHQVLASDPANERAYQHLMFCHIAMGDRDRALQQFVNCQRVLFEELEVDPATETQALYNWIKNSNTTTPSQVAKITNLPIPISSFIGRTLEITHLKQLLTTERLVTLTGAGGSGKTRLAIRTASDILDQFKDGVWWVEFAPLSDASLVSFAVAKALGINLGKERTESETIVNYIKKRQLLLVLDNCEHLVSTIAKLADTMLNNCPDLKILATSREAFGMAGEHVWSVPTLSIPDLRTNSLTELLMQYEGIHLFVERAKSAGNDFNLTEENAFVVTKICQRLDGIPLAIELAAARMKVMSAQQIEKRLDNRFNLLTNGNRTAQNRHMTLRAAVDWSYDSLTDQERQLLNRLSVFSGGWTIDSAEIVCAGKGIKGEDIFDLQARLLDKSLVIYMADGNRYRMLETIREYAREKLIETNNNISDWITRQHLHYFLELAKTVDEKIRGSD